MDELSGKGTANKAAGEEGLVVRTTRFGEVAVAASKQVHFPRGLVGLPDAKRFVFLHSADGQSPFFWLQSADDPALAFVVCEPQHFFPKYRVPLSKEEQEFIGIGRAEDGVVCLILVVPKDPAEITANLRGPLVINCASNVGMQLVLASEEYDTRAPLFPESLIQEGVKGEVRCSS